MLITLKFQALAQQRISDNHGQSATVHMFYLHDV